jgi:Flp pilus assembly protein TadD
MNSHPVERQAVEALYATGHWLLSLDRLRPALDVFRTLTIVAPGDERGWLGLGQTHEKLEDERTAEGLYRLACQTLPDSVRCRVAHARALRAIGDTEGATELLEQAADMASDGDDDELVQIVRFERRGQS